MVATLPPDIPEPGLSWIEVGQWRNWSYEPLLENTININFHLARKYVRIFFSGQSLSQGAKLEVNSELRGIDNVQGQIYENFFLLQMEGTVLGERFKADAPTAPDSLF